MRVSVIVPSYGRSESLRRCLDALAVQIAVPAEVIVVTRADDSATRLLVEEANGPPLAIREQIVEKPGQVAALMAGCEAATGDVIAITDDDAAPRESWVEAMLGHFKDATVAGVGGRDAVEGCETESPQEIVGRVRWWGKVIGNHHLGRGSARDVDVLKGVNMAFRCDRLRRHGFDARLRGAGAQVHNDLKLSLALRREGDRLVYDPGLLVDHYPAPRPEGDHRNEHHPQRQEDATHNETLALLEYLSGPRRLVFVVWALTVGRGPAPGLAHAAWSSIRRPGEGSWTRLRSTLRGRFAGWRTFREGTGSR